MLPRSASASCMNRAYEPDTTVSWPSRDVCTVLAPSAVQTHQGEMFVPPITRDRKAHHPAGFAYRLAHPAVAKVSDLSRSDAAHPSHRTVSACIDH